MIYNLNDMVNAILSAMDSNSVNSIDDTVEATQVAKLVRQCYYDLSVDIGLPEHENLFQLNPSGDTNKPVLMTVPSNVTNLKWIRYDHAESGDTYKDPTHITFMDFDLFLDRQYGLREATSNVGQMTYTSNINQSFQIMYETDRHPLVWTTMDEETIIFDAYDSSIESALVKTKTTCFGTVYPIFEIQDAFTPDLDPTAFSLLLNKAKTRAFMELKQMPNPEAAQETRRQKVINQKRQRSVGHQPKLYETLSRFGRQGPMWSSNNIPRKLRQGD